MIERDERTYLLSPGVVAFVEDDTFDPASATRPRPAMSSSTSRNRSSRCLNTFLSSPGYAALAVDGSPLPALLAALSLAACVLVPAASGATAARPPLVWLKGEGNFTKSHRHPESIDKIVVHVTEGAFWGSVRWLQSPRAHASSHYIVARNGRIVQLVHLSDIAWHAGNWKVNSHSVGIEHEGYTYGPEGFTDAQYHVFGPPRSLDRAPLADADRPEAHHRPRRSAGARRRPRRLVAPHRPRPALELAAATSGSCAATQASRS